MPDSLIIALPLLVILALAMAILGGLLSRRLRREQNAEILRAVIDSSPNPVYSVDARYRYTSFNQPHAAMMKSRYGVEIALRKNLLDAITVEADRKTMRETLDRTLRGERVDEETSSGQGENQRLLEITHSPLRDAVGRVVGVAVIARDVSARRHAEAELTAAHRQTSWLSEAMDRIPAYVYMKDRAGRYTYANRPTLELFKCSAQQLPGCDDARFFPPAVVARLAAIDAKVLERGENTEEELEIAGPDGEPRFYWEVKTPIYDDGNPRAISGLCGISTDITERKRLDLALAASEELYRSVITTMDEGLVVHGADGRIIAINPAAEKILGSSRGEMLARDSADSRWHAVHEDGTPFPGDTHPATVTLQTGRPQSDVVMGVSQPNGERRWISINTHLLASPDGKKPNNVIATFRDITAQKQAEAALRDNERRYRSLFENRHTVMLLIDPTDGLIVDANPAAELYYGWTRAELLRKKMTEINQLPAAEVLKEMDSAKREQRDHFRFRHLRADGSVRDVDVFSSPVDMAGRPLLYSIVIDVTERRLNEERVAAARVETLELLANAERSRRALLNLVEDLRRAEGRLHTEQELAQSTLDALQEHICVLDATGTIIAVNRAWREFGAANGATEKTASSVGENYLAVCRRAVGPEAARAAEFAERLQAVLDGRAGEMQMEYPCDAPGLPRWFLARMVRFAGDASARVVIAHENITARKAAEEQLRASEARYREIFEGSPIGIWEEDFSVVKKRFDELRAAGVTDFRGHLDANPQELVHLTSLVRIVSVNDTCWKMLGCDSREEFVSDLTPYFTAESLAVFKEEMIALAAGQRRFSAEVPIVDRHGKAGVFELSLAVSEGHEHTLSRVLVTTSDISERKAADRALRDSLREKEALLKEVHHRVKNNLQVITSLLRLEAGRNLDRAAQGVLKEMQGRIRSMALLHETLYRSGNFARVDLADYLRQLATQLFRAQNTEPSAVRLVLELAPAEAEIDQAIPCGFIVNELLTNSLKHAFPNHGRGEVRIELKRVDEGRLHLQVSDTGVGLPADFDLSRSQSLGLHLVSDLSRQLQGTLKIGPGASFTLVFASGHGGHQTVPVPPPDTGGTTIPPP